MFRLAVHLLALVAAVGCEKATAPAPASSPPTANAQKKPAPTLFGTLNGKVTLTGWTPPPPAPQMVQCGDHQIAVTNPGVVLKNNGLENVVIYLKNAPPSATTATLAPALLDQKQCVFVPHVVALRTGQPLMVINSDNALHNVHTFPEQNPSLNFGMNTSGSSPYNVVFNKPEIFRVKCDVHPWMSAWIAAFDHPWFAVSSNGGRFVIPHVPAGPQTFVAWHERFGEIEQTVTITPDQPREITFTFEPPKEK